MRDTVQPHTRAGCLVVGSALLFLGGTLTASAATGYEDQGAPPAPSMGQDDAAASQRNGDASFTAEELSTLTQLTEAIATQQAALDERLRALAAATDPATRQSLQAHTEQLQADITELMRLKQELLAPPSSNDMSGAVQAAESLDQQMDRQQQRGELLLNDRANGSAPSP